MRRFKYDIFVSYSRLDDLSPSDERGWVSTFVEILKNQLSKRLGRPASVWYDRSITGERVFNETIKSAIKDSATLVAICSASYRQSEWCTSEREWFAQEGLTVGDQRRLLQVRLMSMPHAQWPEEFQGCAGFDFFSLRDFDPLGSPLDPTDHAFKEELRKIVVAIQSLLETPEPIQALPDTSRPPPPPAVAAPLFISYASQNLTTVLMVADLLRGRSIQYWIDTHMIPGGPNSSLELDRAIKECKAVLWVCSRDSLPSKKVQREIEFARREEKRIISLHIEEGLEIPDELKSWIDDSNFVLAGGEVEMWFEDLLHALRLANVSIGQQRALNERGTGSSGEATATTSLGEYSESYEFSLLKKTFMIDFQKCFSQIKLLSGRKDLHDQLHELQFKFLTPVSDIFANESISIDYQLQSMLRLYWFNLSEILDNLGKITSINRVIPERELIWMKDLEKAHADFDEGIRRIDLARMRPAIATVDKVLAHWPSRINTQLTETARDLSLAELVRKLQLLCDKSTTFKQLLGDKACELEQSASSISTLADIHDGWQIFDADLRLTITQSLRDIEDIWPGLKDKAANLYAVNPGNWTQRFKHLSGEIDLAIQARDLDLAKGYFIRFTSAARDRFYLADQDLKKSCSMLQQISAPIEAILSASS
jgi:hypothetical protein